MNNSALNHMDLVLEIIKSNPFATFCINVGEYPVITSLPVCLNETTDGLILIGHCLKTNDLVQAAQESSKVSVIFNGAHSYISPHWYSQEPAVPTWNYARVVAQCELKVVDNPEETLGMVNRLVDVYEQHRPWEVSLGKSGMDVMSKAIVGLSLQVLKLEATFKCSQNRTLASRDTLTQALRDSGEDQKSVMADLIETCVERGVPMKTISIAPGETSYLNRTH